MKKENFYTKSTTKFSLHSAYSVFLSRFWFREKKKILGSKTEPGSLYGQRVRFWIETQTERVGVSIPRRENLIFAVLKFLLSISPPACFPPWVHCWRELRQPPDPQGQRRGQPGGSRLRNVRSLRGFRRRLDLRILCAYQVWPQLVNYLSVFHSWTKTCVGQWWDFKFGGYQK